MIVDDDDDNDADDEVVVNILHELVAGNLPQAISTMPFSSMVIIIIIIIIIFIIVIVIVMPIIIVIVITITEIAFGGQFMSSNGVVICTLQGRPYDQHQSSTMSSSSTSKQAKITYNGASQ